MKFRTEILPPPFGRRMGYGQRTLALGSCFAQEMGRRMQRARLPVEINPAGTLFNPASVARTLRRLAEGALPRREELHEAEGRWFHYDFHSSLCAPTADATLERLAEAVRRGHEALDSADRLLVTLGTAWIFERRDTGETVANCHKQPAALFRRRRMEVEEIVRTLGDALRETAPGRQIVLTVSPVRHLADGAAENSLSKATLRLAAEALCRTVEGAVYFPAYELLTDDLRDYRFYADDLVHPSAQAVEYVWERFAAAALTPEALALVPRAERIVAAAAHRPLDAASAAYRTFCLRQLEAIEALPEVDFTAEKRYFRRQIEINS